LEWLALGERNNYEIFATMTVQWLEPPPFREAPSFGGLNSFNNSYAMNSERRNESSFNIEYFSCT
jgi:hypothetical protein